MIRVWTALAACGFTVAVSATEAQAWGSVGHVMISRLGAQTLPASLPAFVRSQAAVDEIAILGPEPDRLKGAGKTFDADLDPAHYLDLGDDGRIGGSVALAALPPSQRDFDAALRAAGTDEYRTGYLPYAIIDGWQRVAARNVGCTDRHASRSVSPEDRVVRRAALSTRKSRWFRASHAGGHHVYRCTISRRRRGAARSRNGCVERKRYAFRRLIVHR